VPNGGIEASAVEEACASEGRVQALLAEAASRLSFSARAYFRVLRIARTISDLARSDRVGEEHVAEALGYRGSPAP